MVRRAHQLHHRGGLRLGRSALPEVVAGGTPRDRQGHHPFPLRDLAGDAPFRGDRASANDLRSRLRLSPGGADLEDARQRHQSPRYRGSFRSRPAPLLPDAGGEFRQGLRLYVGELHQPLQSRSGERSGEPAATDVGDDPALSGGDDPAAGSPQRASGRTLCRTRGGRGGRALPDSGGARSHAEGYRFSRGAPGDLEARRAGQRLPRSDEAVVAPEGGRGRRRGRGPSYRRGPPADRGRPPRPLPPPYRRGDPAATRPLRSGNAPPLRSTVPMGSDSRRRANRLCGGPLPPDRTSAGKHPGRRGSGGGNEAGKGERHG